MEYFNFDPNEVQILEDIEFDETIQREEKVRFYTLTEQTTDAYEKLLPKGKVTRFQREEVRKEIDRLQDLYTHYVLALPEEYRLREPEYSRIFSWVHPVYASRDLKSYNWRTSWEPLFESIRQPGFYLRMIQALPRPFVEAGTSYPLIKPTRFVSSEGIDPIVALPEYLATRTVRHEDKTIEVVRIPIEGSQDTVEFTGYYLEKRPLDIPNPFPEHPFLKENVANMITTTAPLKDVVPSLDAILTHAVPSTQDPYQVATPYLKLYDVQLTDIPWNTWKSKFKPVETISEVPPSEPIALPKLPDTQAPSENVLQEYNSQYMPGLSVRLWLMNQLDGGGLVHQLLRSRLMENGSVETRPAVDLQTAPYPKTTLEECRLSDTNFQDFKSTGVLRREWTVVKDKDRIDNFCVPIEFIQQERGKVGYLNRTPWSESTESDIKTSYTRRLKEVRRIEPIPPKVEPVPKTPMRSESIRRTEVLVIQNDPRRFSDDKLRDIRELLKETTLTRSIYSDPDGQFVFCEHTLAVLSGDLETNRMAYYDTWAARVDGFRVCKFCGEHINSDVLVDQVQFDEDGFVIQRTDAFETTVFHGTGIASFTTGLTALRPLFIQENAHDDTVFLILSILQVLPTADQLEPLLKLGRAIAAAQFTKGSAANIAKFTGMVGLATAALILQTHRPTLVPRRAFGSRPLILSGYPRDSDKPGDYTIVQTLLGVLQKTFEAFPTSFKGASQQLVRAVLTDPGEIKKTVTVLLSSRSPLMTKGDIPALLAKAKAYHSEQPPMEVPKALLPVMLPPKEMDVIRSFEPCPSSRPIWTSGRLPPIVQAVIPLRTGLLPARTGILLPPTQSSRAEPTPVSDAEIRRRLTTTKNLPSSVAIRDPYRTNLAVASRLSDMFILGAPVRTIDPQQVESKLRDIGRGVLTETLTTITQDPVKRAKFDERRFKDVALYTLLADYTKEKAEVNKLRAAERIRFVQRMAQKSDQEREIIQDLLAIGLAPYIMTNQDRVEFAQEAQRLQEEVFQEETEVDYEADTGVGQPQDYFDQGEEGPRGADNGDYGDYGGAPGNDGRDHEQPQMTDDPASSI